jgi:filamentous hemagglutinin
MTPMLRRIRLVALLLVLPAAEWTVTDPPIDYAHIAQGEINSRGEAVGYHHRSSGIDPAGAQVRRIVQPPDASGVYRALVAVRDPGTGAWVEKRAASTFFPDAMSDREVVDAILSAFRDASVAADGHFVGPSGRGFAIDGWYERGRIRAAYPLRGPQ